MASTDQSVRRAGIFVVVPTTDQPIVLKKLAWSARVPISRVVLVTESSEVCEPWSTQYGNMLRPGEPLRTILGLPDGGSYRLAASAAIDQGKSWMVPITAAHCALAQGEAITHKAAEARLLIWGTGAIDISVADTASEARIVAQEYHLTTKIDRSRHFFAEAAHAGTPVLALIPQGEEAERAAGIMAKVLGSQPHHVAIVSSLADITAPIELYLRSGVFVPVVVTPPEPSRALEPFVPPPKAEAPGTDASKAAPEPVPAAAAADSSAQTSARRSVLGEQSKSSLSVPLVLTVAVVLMGAATAAVTLMRDPTPPAAPAPVAAAVTQPPTASQQPVTTTTAQPVPTSPPPAAAGPALARLVTLSPPTGSSCDAQVYEMRPRFVETAIDVPDAPDAVTIDAQEICGVAITPLGASKVRFQTGTGSAGVPSQSSPTRIIFNPAGTRGSRAALPTIQIDEPKALRIEIKRR
ncbi:hypothetical protein [Bosea sp. PAMC 26642]|uniref:hypothetical protein n=1 Tax=Bosea sp. (strain PAMC 26642) TaxID=1792307 RepID=UPI0007702C3E|nr:hypothetical protein [Bosea sp. PAMC 26642]AMJ61795.1 hypothetical protein AXW83_17100 [Bosea sp. PAMC 26642]